MAKDFSEFTTADWTALADRLDGKSNEHFKTQYESFERCDTDGFVSQWAHSVLEERESVKAQIARNNGFAVFNGLYEGKRRIKAREIQTRFGSAWLLHEDETVLIAKRGKHFLPTGENSRVLKSLGLEEREESAPAWATLDGSGTGLSGNVWVKVYRRGDKWGQDAKAVPDSRSL